MQWSKLKTRVKAFMVPSLRKRIDFHVTSYRSSHDEAEKAWVSVDGEQVFTASWYRHQYAGAMRSKKGTLERDGRGRAQRDPILPEWVTKAEQLGLHRPQQFGDALRQYLEISIKDALTSKDPFIRALALIDARVGTERLASVKPGPEEHSLVRLFYKLRCETIKPSISASPGIQLPTPKY
jgi:hypothetical protein